MTLDPKRPSTSEGSPKKPSMVRVVFPKNATAQEIADAINAKLREIREAKARGENP